MNRILEQLKTFLDALDPLRRKVLVGALVVSALSVVTVAWFVMTDVYTVVLEGDRRDRVQATVAQLEELGIPYRVIGGGTGLEVPEQYQGRAFRLSQDAATAPDMDEMPEAKGFMTPRDQEQRYKFLLQQRIAQNIAALKGINRARVELVQAGDSTFFAEETPARAAVVLELEGGVTFSNQQVRGVVALITNSVDGLDRENVSIVDDGGKVLFEGPQGEFEGGLNAQLMSRKRALEEDLQDKVADHLVRRLGSSMDFTVTALVELSTESSTLEIREVDPESVVTISSSLTEERSQQERSGGVPGTASSLPEKVGASSGSGTSSERLNEKFNYDVSQTLKTVQQSPGAVKRQAVSVQVDQSRLLALQAAAAVGEDAEEAGESAEVDPQWVAAQSKLIEDSIRAAVFFDTDRGDVLHVTVTPFSPLEMEAAPTGFTVSEAMPYARYGVATLALFLLFFTVLRPLVGRVIDVRTPDDLLREAKEAASEEYIEPEPDDNLASRLRDLVDNFEPVDAADLNRLVDREDEASAQVIRLWNSQS